MQSSFWILACVAPAILSVPSAAGQETGNRQVVVRAEAEGLPSAYGAPPEISHDFPHEIEWAMNIVVDHEFGSRESTNGGFAQSIEVPVLLPEEKLEVGLEMQYRSGGEALGPIGTTKGLAIGPTLAWRPTKNARFDLSPLLGCSDHTPAAQVFAVFSFSFGGPGGGDVESPASTRGQ